jgi:hypothetical protein
MRTLVLLRNKWRGKKRRRVLNNNKQTNKQTRKWTE